MIPLVSLNAFFSVRHKYYKKGKFCLLIGFVMYPHEATDPLAAQGLCSRFFFPVFVDFSDSCCLPLEVFILQLLHFLFTPILPLSVFCFLTF